MSAKVDRMTANYELKLRLRGRPRPGDPSIEQQVERYRIAHEHQAEIQHETRLVLGALGVCSIYFPYYYACVQQVDRELRKGANDHRLVTETRALAELWVARGLDREALKAVLVQVLNVDLKRMYPDDPVPGAGQQPPTA
jgi:hypothetical protein